MAAAVAATGQVFEADAHPRRAEMGKRELPLTGTVYIDAEDYSDDPPPGCGPQSCSFPLALPLSLSRSLSRSLPPPSLLSVKRGSTE